MPENIYENIIGSDFPFQEHLDVIRQSEYCNNISEFLLISALSDHSKTSVESGIISRTYNENALKYSFVKKPYPSTTMGNLLSDIAEKGSLIKPLGKFSGKSRYGINSGAVSVLMEYKRESYEKRKKRLEEIFGGNKKEVIKFLDILAGKNQDLLESKPDNRNRKTYKKSIVPAFLAREIHLDADAVYEALDLVSESNGVVPFILKDGRKKGNLYYVNGKQLFPINEFRHYYLSPPKQKN